MFENSVLRRIFGPNRDGEGGKYKKFDNSEVHHDLYSSPNIISMIKQRRIRWTMHLARMG